MTIRSLIVGAGGGSMTATSIARALLARGLTDAQVRAAIGGAGSVVAGLTAVLTTPVPAPTPAPSPTPTPAPTPTPTPTAPVAIPAGFALSTLPFAITRTGSGEQSTFATDYDQAAKRPATATTIYVAPGGTANAAGTQADPVPSINMAIAIGNATAQPYAIEVAAGTYLATQAYTRSAAPAATYVAAWYNTAPTQNCAIYCPSGTAISSLQAASVTWAATADPNVWRGTTPNDGTKWVVDLALLDDTGVPTGLDQVRMVADLANPIPEINAAWTATRGASYYRSGTCWVRLPDNRQPTNATVIVGRDFSAATAGGLPTAPTANLRIWMDGLQFRFGKKPFGITTNATYRVDVYARACAFLYASAHGNGGEGAGAFSFAGGPGDVILDRCIASYSDLDGFNYHGPSGATSRETCPTVYELGCKSRSAGWTGGLANNSTTLHESCVGVRIGGDYRNNADRTVHDINRSHSWNLGCIVVPRRGPDGSEQSAGFAAGHPTDGLASQMWVDACKVIGPPQYPTEAYPGSTLRHANLAFVPVAAVGGTVAAYAP